MPRLAARPTGWHGTAARFFEALRLAGGSPLRPETIREARRPAREGPVQDRTWVGLCAGRTASTLGGVSTPADLARFMGDPSCPEAFGHIGSDCYTAWGDPTRELVFVYLTALLLRTPAGIAHHGLVADRILRACG